MRGEHHSIAMQSERIVIVAGAKDYQTEVNFVFRNDGPKTSVQMGFPENIDSGEGSFSRFSTWVDGRQTKARRVRVAPYSAVSYWLKTVDFAAHQTRRVRVSYFAPWGNNTSFPNGPSELVYNFTGQGWKGRVARSDLEIRVKEPELWMALPSFNGKALPMSFANRREGAVFRKTWRNWQAQGTFLFDLEFTVPLWMQDSSDLDSDLLALVPHVRTFRIGAVPKDALMRSPDAPGFVRDGVAYVALWHLRNRLEGFSYQLEKHRGFKPEVALHWNSKRRIATLMAGSQPVDFTPEVGTPHRPLLLRSRGYNTLYVPLADACKTLGLTWKVDAQNHLFEIKRGTWTGKS